MEAFNWYLSVVKNYVGFEGRAGRSEFWYFTLVNFIIAIVINVLGSVLGMKILGTIYALALLLPSIAVSIRRLHDIGKSGWWLLVGFIPVIGIFVLIYFYVQASEVNENRFGPMPATQPTA